MDNADVLKELSDRPAVPVGVAAHLLGRSRFRVYQLLDNGRLERVSVFGSSFVSLSSISQVLAKRQQVQL